MEIKLWPGLALVVFCVNSSYAVNVECDEQLSTSSGIACYKVVEGAYEWEFAKSECERIGGDLVTIKSQQENDLVQKIMFERTLQDVWLGMQEKFSKWSWLDGREVRGQGCFFDNETDSDFATTPDRIPDNHPELCIQSCASIGFKYAALFNGAYCLCDDDFGRYGQRDAECTLQCPGLRLNSPITCGGSSSNDVFAVHGEYSNWQPGQPNDHLGYQTCAVMDGDNGYMWNDVGCHERNGLVCRLKMQDPVLNCKGSSHVLVNGTCFYVSFESDRYFESRMACISLNGDLAYFASSEEETAVVNLIKANESEVSGFWLGLVRWNWEWTTKEDIVFSNWGPNQPNGVEQHCAAIEKDFGQWSDEDCTSVHKILCEIDNSTIVKATTRSQVTKFSLKTDPPSIIPTTVTETPTSPKPGPLDKLKEFYENNKVVVYIIIAVVGGLFLGIIVCAIVCATKRNSGRKSASGRREDVSADHFFGLQAQAEARKITDTSIASHPPQEPPDLIPTNETLGGHMGDT